MDSIVVYAPSDAPPDWAGSLGAHCVDLPETVRGVVEAALTEGLGASVALVQWDVMRAPLVGALCERLRTPDRLVGAVCDARAEIPLALITGADWACVGAPLEAELHAALIARRRAGAAPAEPPAASEQLGPIRIDDRRKTITVGGHELPLSPRLYDLLAYLVANPGRTVSRDDLLAGVWGLDFDPETNVVDVYMHYLRRALRPHGFDRSVVTVRGRGYRLDLDAAQAQA